jgi:hypothetical protein
VNVASETSIEQFAHPANLQGDVDGLGPEMLAAGESQKLPGQAGTALRCLDHPVHETAPAIRVRLAVEHIEAAGNHHQQIVEVVRDATRQLSDGFDLLRMAKRLLDASTLLHFDAQLLVGLLERSRALDDELLELLGSLLTRLEQGANFILPTACPHRRLDGAGQRHRLNWPFEERHVPEQLHDLATPGDDRWLRSMAGENDEWQVGPWRLLLDPLRERRRFLPEQALFGKNNGSCAAGHPVDQFGETSTVDRFEIRMTEKLDGRLSVAADRRKYKNPVVPIKTHPAHPSGIIAPV